MFIRILVFVKSPNYNIFAKICQLTCNNIYLNKLFVGCNFSRRANYFNVPTTNYGF